jgi:rRNA maturation endonuclease Nob1
MEPDPSLQPEDAIMDTICASCKKIFAPEEKGQHFCEDCGSDPIEFNWGIKIKKRRIKNGK